MQKPIGILGGTFDPIHLGHLHLADKICKKFDLQKIKIIPCYQSPTRSMPIASAIDRIAMIKLAIAKHPALELDDREIKPAKKSYTIETLQSLRQELPDVPLCLIIGTDAFSHLPEWREWKRITDFAHLIVVKRSNPKNPLPQISNLNDIHQHLGGSFLITDIHALEISSTMIRNLIKQKKNVEKFVPKEISSYINEHRLYTASP